MTELRKLLIEIEDFEEIRQKDFIMYKTRLIEQLLIQWAEVNVFTRPRRFGKSLNMSMFQQFFPGVQNLMRQIREIIKATEEKKNVK